MQRILTFDQPEPPASAELAPDEEFELVIGRRQMAAITFLALVLVAVCSGASYLAGKALASRASPSGEESIQPAITLEQPPASLPAPMIEATIVPPAAKPVQNSPISTPAPVLEAPLFASPVRDAIYIQVGAVEKGVATVIAEGLRKHALNSFVAPGPTDKTFRVLIGPFPDAEAYQNAQNIVDRIGLASFARRYQPQ